MTLSISMCGSYFCGSLHHKVEGQCYGKTRSIQLGIYWMLLNKKLAQLLIPASNQVSRFMPKMLSVLFCNFGLLTAKFTLCSWIIILRRSSDSNVGKCQNLWLEHEGFGSWSLAKRGCFGHNSYLAVQRLSATRCLHMSFILEYLVESEKWIQECTDVVIKTMIIGINFCHDYASK